MADCIKCKRTDVKCCPTCARDSYTCNVWHHCGEDCEKYEPQKQTNADRIRAMSDEELAEWLLNHDNITAEKGRLSKDELLQWLKSEAKE